MVNLKLTSDVTFSDVVIHGDQFNISIDQKSPKLAVQEVEVESSRKRCRR